MVIILKLSLAFITLHILGYGVTKLTRAPISLAIAAGYALSQVIYFLAYMALFRPTLAFIASITIPLALSIFAFFKKRHFPNIVDAPSPTWKIRALCGVLIVVSA